MPGDRGTGDGSLFYAFRRELAALAVLLLAALVFHTPLWLTAILAVSAWAIANEVTRRVVTTQPTVPQLIDEFDRVAAQLPQRESSLYVSLASVAREVNALTDTALDPIEREALLRESLTTATLLGKKLLEGGVRRGHPESSAETEYRQLIHDLTQRLLAIRSSATDRQDQEMRAEIAAFRELLTPSVAEENINRHG